MVVLKQKLKSKTGGFYEIVLEAESFSEERVAEYEIAEEVEGFSFAEYRDEDDGGISHALDVADIRSEDMEDLEKLADISDKTTLCVILCLAVKRPLYIFFDLYSHLLTHPVLLSPLQQLQIQRVTYPNSVLHQIHPNYVSQLFGHKFFNQRQTLLPKERDSHIGVAISVDYFIPILQDGVTFNTHFLL